MSIARNSAFAFASQLATLVITALTGILLNRMLGAAGRGAYVLATALAFTQLQVFVSLGAQTSLQVFVARDRSCAAALHAWTLLLAGAVTLLAAGGVALFWRPITQGLLRGIAPASLWMITASMAPAFYWMAWQGFMIGLGEIRALSLFHIALALAQNAAIAVTLLLMRPGRFPERADACVTWLVALYVGILFLAAIAMALLLRRRTALWSRPRLADLARLLSFGARVHVANVLSNLLAQLDQILVNGLAGVASLGVYQQAASLANKVWMVSGAIDSSSYQPVTAASREDARRLVADLFRITFYISLILILIGWIAAPLIPLVYGEEFRAAVYPFRTLLLGASVFGCGRVFSIYFTGQKRSPQTLLALNACLLPLHACLCLWLIPAHGLAGACWATTGAYTFSMLILFGLFLREGRGPALSRFFAPQKADVDRVRRILRRLTGGENA